MHRFILFSLLLLLLLLSLATLKEIDLDIVSFMDELYLNVLED